MIEIDPHVARHWRSIKRPKGVHIVEETEQFARYVVEPLELVCVPPLKLTCVF